MDTFLDESSDVELSSMYFTSNIEFSSAASIDVVPDSEVSVDFEGDHDSWSVTSSSSWDLEFEESFCSDDFVATVQPQSESNTPPSEPSQPGSCLSALESAVLLLLFVIRHSLTGKAFSELINLLRLHLPRPDTCLLRSVHSLKKFFLQMFSETKAVVHAYCSKCSGL